MTVPDSTPTSDDELRRLLRRSPLLAGLEDDDFDTLHGQLDEIALEAGETLFRRDQEDRALYLVISGLLEASREDDDGERTVLGTIGPGEAVGEIQLLTGGERTADVTAAEPSRLVRLPAAAIDELTADRPRVMHQLLTVIQRRLRHNQLAELAAELFGIEQPEALADFEHRVEWQQLASGDTLFLEGDPGDALWIVMSGLLASLVADDTGARLVGEVGRGELLGEMAVVTGEPRAATVRALRDSELVKVSNELFERLVERDPRILMEITRRVVRRLRRTLHAEPRRTALSLALVPCGEAVPLAEFSARLAAALGEHGGVLELSGDRVDSLLGAAGVARTPPGDPRNLRLSTWLEDQEARQSFLVLETDRDDTPWTRRCLQQARIVLLVGGAGDDPSPGAVEAALPAAGVAGAAARRVLVLLHDTTDQPDGTARWLAARRVDEHHHVAWRQPDGCARLARFLSGRAVGLALGGGGARGFAHYGVFRALQEAGVPVDMIGGTSMGAVIGAQCALGWDLATMLETNRRGLIARRPFAEFTLPLFSLVRSRKLDRVLEEAHGDTRIEDLWLPYFCVSSNLSLSSVMVHREGSLRRALRASSALPGIVLPVASREGLLVDGGLLNNLPGDLVGAACDTVVVSDVSAGQEIEGRYGRFPSPWQVLLSRALPFRKPVNAPYILDVLMGSTLLSSVGHTRRVMGESDLCIEPPVDRYGLLQFEALEELVEAGYQHARGEIERWLEERPPRWRGAPV